MTIVSDYVALFDGRHDAVGTETGGCLRTKDYFDWCELIEAHLQNGGPEAIGIYPLVHRPDHVEENGAPGEIPGWSVHWGCVDFDEGEDASWTYARNLKNVLAHVDVQGWIERSRSKGYHVWVFARRGEWVPAATVRRGLLVACQLGGAPIKYINPTAEAHDDPTFLGNYVRLPYPGCLTQANTDYQWVSDRRVIVNDQGDAYSIEQFVSPAHGQAGLQGLERLAAMWQPPAPPAPRVAATDIPALTGVIVDRMRPLARKMFDEGPYEGADRSSWLYKLGATLYDDGLHTWEECIALLTDADARHGKFHGRRDADQRLAEILEKVWR
jgi:hypothetical protein